MSEKSRFFFRRRRRVRVGTICAIFRRPNSHSISLHSDPPFCHSPSARTTTEVRAATEGRDLLIFFKSVTSDRRERIEA